MTKHTLLANLHAGIDHLVAEALEAARASGRIAPVTEYAAYRFDIVTAWNQFEEAGLASLSRWDRDSLVGPLKRIFAMKALSDAQKALESEPASPALEARFLAQAETLIATGTAPYGPGVAGEAHTGVVPGRFHVCLEDWVLSIVMDNPDRGIFDRSKPAFITPLDIDARPVLTAPIDLPSGDLLIADWIRIAAFTRAVDSSDCQINFASERMRRTLRGIRTHNLIEVSCGNTCPSILPDGDGIRFAAINHDEETDLPLFPEEEILGMVITDYWAITAIDIVDLRAILATADPEADPDALIDAWLQGQWGHCVTRVRLAPGRWYASFVDDRITPEVSCLEEAGLPGPGGIETVLALSREAPTLDPALSRAV